MKAIKTFLVSGTLLAASCPMFASVTITLPEGTPISSINTSRVLIEDYLKSGSRPASVDENLTVSDNKIVFNETMEGAARYVAELTPTASLSFFTTPGESLVIDVKSIEPIDYAVSGSPLMEGIYDIDSKIVPVYSELRGLNSAAADYQAQLEALVNKYNTILLDYVAENPGSPASAYALTMLDGEDFFKGYEKLNDEGKKSVLFPMVSQKYEREEKVVKLQRLQAELSSGEKVAPEIELPDMDGKIVKLSDFRGKWVIIDFWGSWCGWCIKGFPKLKEVYEANKDRLEVFGVDNGDTPEAWKAAVAKYSLPWINVYNAGSNDRFANDVLAEYGVQGFPTKVIVNPEGKIANITTGEDPNFFTILESLMK